MSTETPEVPRFDAENATTMTADFLKRLGYKGSWLPMKVSLEGELYIVEMVFQKLTAKVQINSATKEIKEYELQEGETETNSFFKSKRLMFLIAAGSIAVVAAALLGVL
ncbi:MAG: hypothetical protein ACLQO7_03110 [Candidatus Bathyarchaeia archaeon]